MSFGILNRLFRAVFNRRLGAFTEFSLSRAWLSRTVRMTYYTQPVQYGAENRPNYDGWWQVCSYAHHLRRGCSRQCDMYNTGNRGYHTNTSSEDCILIPIPSM